MAGARAGTAEHGPEGAAPQAYGSAESDYRPERWGGFREDYRFTGKEEDVEVGLTYFGKRYLSAGLGRWVSADPLTVHRGGADLNGYAYVSGQVLKNVDPLGLKPKGDRESVEQALHDQTDGAYGRAVDPPKPRDDREAIEQALHDQTGGAYGVDHVGRGPRSETVRTAEEVRAAEEHLNRALHLLDRARATLGALEELYQIAHSAGDLCITPRCGAPRAYEEELKARVNSAERNVGQAKQRLATAREQHVKAVRSRETGGGGPQGRRLQGVEFPTASRPARRLDSLAPDSTLDSPKPATGTPVPSCREAR